MGPIVSNGTAAAFRMAALDHPSMDWWAAAETIEPLILTCRLRGIEPGTADKSVYAAALLNIYRRVRLYDVTISAGALAYRYAGRVETDRASITDPAMGAARP
jgi:hypothetical protein